MTAWQGKRTIAVVSASMRSDGLPDFALTEVEVTHDEYENGVLIDLVEDRLADAGFEEPWVHFDELEAPAFLLPAVTAYLVAQKETSDATQPV
jgi:hypothetical protein